MLLLRAGRLCLPGHASAFFYQNPEATDLFRKVNEYCIAPPEVGNYWQVGEEDGLPEGGAGRYACRVAAGCFPGVL